MMPIKRITLISMILSLILSLGIAFAAPTTLYVDPSSVTNTGEFTIYIKVSDVTNLYGYEFKLEYDTGILDATEITIGSFLNGPTYPVVQEINDPAGYVWVGISSLNPAAPKSGSGTLATITFQVTGSGSCALNLYDSTLGDYDANPMGHDVNDGYFSSTGTACRADLNSDGKVNILDAILLAKAFGSYPGHPNWNPVADINDEPDGKVNILDAIKLAGEFGREDC